MREDTSTAVESPSVATQYLAAEETYGETSNRLRALEAKATIDGLTTEETLEQLALERQQASMGPRLERLRRQTVYEQTTMNIEAVQAAWNADVPSVQQDYQRLSAALAVVAQYYQAVVDRHRAREQVVAGLPQGVRERLSFPDTGSFETNLAARLGVDLRSIGGLTPPQMEAAMDPDPKGRAINSRMLQRYLEEAKAWMQRQ